MHVVLLLWFRNFWVVGVGVVSVYFFRGVGVWLLYRSGRLCVCWCAGLSCTDVDYVCVCVAACHVDYACVCVAA